jgi:hypothetical protein
MYIDRRFHATRISCRWRLESVTLQSNSSTDKDVALQTLEADIAHQAQSHHVAVQVNATVVDGETRAKAHEQNLSPAKP